MVSVCPRQCVIVQPNQSNEAQLSQNHKEGWLTRSSQSV